MFSRAVRRIPAVKPPQGPAAPSSTRYLSQRARPSSQHQYGRPQTCQFARPPLRTQTRSYTHYERLKRSYRVASKGILQKHPFLFPFALISAIGSTAYLGYVVYMEVMEINPQYHNFPPEVAKPLRRAVYYTDVDSNPSKAMNSFKEALVIADHLGLHPYSDEVLGIKLNISMMLEKAGLIKAAIEVLERVRAESLAWVEEVRRKKLLRENERAGEKKTPAVSDDPEEAAREEEKRREEEQNEDRLREKTLKKIIGMGLKLGELYATEGIQDHAKAETAMTSSIELCLEEMRRRQRLGLPVGGGGGDSWQNDDTWMNLSEIASTFDELATFYANKDKNELAAPLYLQALTMVKEDEGDSTTCKQVVLLNNVASAMAGQAHKPTPAQFASSSSSNNPLPRDRVIDSARQWAQKAIDVAEHIQPPVRTEECDVSCAVATYNLGELAEMRRDFEGARKRYEEARDFAKGIGFEEAAARADEAMKRLDKSK